MPASFRNSPAGLWTPMVFPVAKAGDRSKEGENVRWTDKKRTEKGECKKSFTKDT